VPLTTHVDPEHADALREVAKDMRCSRSEVVRRILEDFIASRETTTGAAA
jgi:predicted transcriptional regulator